MRRLRFILASICGLVLAGLGSAQEASLPAQAALQYGPPREWCTVQDQRIVESSGLAPARLLPQQTMFWTHNDGAGEPRLFLIDAAGETVGQLDVTDFKADDVEELCSFTSAGKNWLLLADIGDNNKARKHVRLCLISEPIWPTERDNKKKRIKWEAPPTLTCSVKYSDGSHNCEALSVDLASQQIILISKEKEPGCAAFVISLTQLMQRREQPNDEPLLATKIADVRLPTILGLTISADGKRLVALGRGELFQFVRIANRQGELESWGQTLTRAPQAIEKPKQKQGEAVCFGPDETTLFLSSEGIEQPIWAIPAK